MFSDTAITDRHSVTIFSSLELTGCGYPGLLDRKNRSDVPRWESNPQLPACKASTDCCMLNKSICHFRGVGSILFLMENPLANNVGPDQMPHHVASDLGLQCLLMTLKWVSR